MAMTSPPSQASPSPTTHANQPTISKSITPMLMAPPSTSISPTHSQAPSPNHHAFASQPTSAGDSSPPLTPTPKKASSPSTSERPSAQSKTSSSTTETSTGIKPTASSKIVTATISAPSPTSLPSTIQPTAIHHRSTMPISMAKSSFSNSMSSSRTGPSGPLSSR